ncbi:MAG: hypothetical protein OHK0039_29700 [Bacteroidia bacterium]
MATRHTPQQPRALNFEEIKAQKYGPEDSAEHIDFQARARIFRVGQRISQLRKELDMTQQELADRIGTQKSHISRIENGADMNLSTLFKIFDYGFQRPLQLLSGEVID